MDDVRSTCASAGSLSHFPAQWGPACHPTLPGGGRGGKEWVLLELVRGRWTGSLGNRLGERGPWSHLGHVTATIQGI